MTDMKAEQGLDSKEERTKSKDLKDQLHEILK